MTQHTRELIALLIIVVCLIITAHAFTKKRVPKCKVCGLANKNVEAKEHPGICCNCAHGSAVGI